MLKELQQERSRLDEAIRVGPLVTGNHNGAKRAKRTLSTAVRERMAPQAFFLLSLEAIAYLNIPRL